MNSSPGEPNPLQNSQSLQQTDREAQVVTLSFKQGTLLVEGRQEEINSLGECVFDKRTLQYRARASSYRQLVVNAHKQGITLVDQARKYSEIDCRLKKAIVPRSHQAEALAAWLSAHKNGVVSLPTGAGKTILALLAIEKAARSTLIVVPTIDLLLQWQEVLAAHLSQPIGLVGGGHRSIEAITVSTYDSARMIIENVGNQFGFLIVDECHHLPAPQYQIIGAACIAPFRLGLSATLERSDGKESVIYDLLGEKIYEGAIRDLVANTLAPYDVVNIEVDLSAEEKASYDASRQRYMGFIRKMGIDFSKPDGWKQFIMRSARSREGKDAMTAYREQKNLAQAATAKFDQVWSILNRHSQEPIIVFTDNNEFAYQIGSAFMLAVLTHKTK
ncbi:MAG: DEAD/DEAH box helicase family protein, partial [Oligoflexales bacterium]|nr:DEAD/DEAH box helicase family protein [Oligoflexales bacterium]